MRPRYPIALGAVLGSLAIVSPAFLDQPPDRIAPAAVERDTVPIVPMRVETTTTTSPTVSKIETAASVDPTTKAKRTAPPTTTIVILPPPEFPVGLNGLPFAPDGLDNCTEMNFYRVQWGLPQRFDDSGRHQLWVASDGLGWREAKCGNHEVSPNGCCGGYWQLYIGYFLKDHRMQPRLAECDVDELGDVTGDGPYDKQRQACAARALYDIDGLAPWA